MTSEQKRLFADIAVMGFMCGLTHPFEWYENALLHFTPILPYHEQSKMNDTLTQMMIAFLQETYGPQDSDIPLTIDEDYLHDCIDAYYKAQNHRIVEHHKTGRQRD